MKTQIILLILLSFVFQSFAQEESTPAPEFRTVPLQFTFMTPPIGTNGTLFYKTINDVSLNTFIGVGAASNFVELSGFIGVNRLYSDGVQLSGFANISGFDPLAANYSSEGVQLTGFANINGNTYNGIQGAGFMNINRSFQGLQGSGFLNINQSSSNSFQGAGFMNVNKQSENGFMGAGFANVALKGTNRVQGAGFLNVSENIAGVQGAGFANVSKSMKGIQGAGFANVAQDVQGIQASGFINVAKNVKGLQVAGFINVCDSIEGLPIGFISVVKKNGYRNIEVSTSEWSPVQLTYRMGIEKLYNVYTVSMLPGGFKTVALGFGFGHNRQILDKTDLNIELVHHQEFMLKRPVFMFTAERENSISQLKVGVRRYVLGNMWVNAGPTFNLGYAYLPENSSFEPTGKDLQPYLWDVAAKRPSNFLGWNTRFWVGFHAGISFN